MDAIASQITSLTIVYSTVYSDADQTKHQSSASLAFVRGIHRGPVNSPRKCPVTRKIFPFDDVIMICRVHLVRYAFMTYFIGGLKSNMPYQLLWPSCYYLRNTDKYHRSYRKKWFPQAILTYLLYKHISYTFMTFRYQPMKISYRKALHLFKRFPFLKAPNDIRGQCTNFEIRKFHLRSANLVLENRKNNITLDIVIKSYCRCVVSTLLCHSLLKYREMVSHLLYSFTQL